MDTTTIHTSTNSQIKTFILEHIWTVECFQQYLNSSKKERFIDSNIQHHNNKFKYFLRLSIEPPGLPYVELHVEALKDIKFEIHYKIGVQDVLGVEVKYLSNVDWISKHLKSTPGKVDIFTGPDLNVDLIEENNPELLEKGKLKIFSVIKFVAEENTTEL